MTIQPDTKLSKEYTKLLSRREELSKQETSLKREYTTLLRKMVSLMTVLQELEDVDALADQSFSPVLLSKIPELEEYQHMLLQLDGMDSERIEIPDNLAESYSLYRNSSMLYKDA
ncbi:LAFE_0B01772g1_1 [Lachancea fermentati]|uniref:LAFE_0B01772g1_1 n=1 Tax=Lachancea fermentati TaxID=4955 RepID=A0A1G4M7H3_LACFM|nr:LAFE_0B01772g1_1 [Lachancea fermentati]